MSDTQKFGRYTVLKLLGQGAMGTVYLAHDPVLERKVALKVISVDAMVDRSIRADYLKRFSFEAKASAKLNHPSIVAVYDAGEENGLPWIAFQYVQGETLESLLAQKGKLPVGRAIAFARDIASALRHAHGWSIVHRDIKPANILIESSTGVAKLADFGIVKAPWAVLSHEENTLGSPGYMSPEQIDGVDLDERADLFCLGVVMYQMVSGMHPFLRDTMAATIFATCNNDYTPLGDIVAEVPPSLDWAVRRCLAADRDKRIRSANELVAMLNKEAPDPPSGLVSKDARPLPHPAVKSARDFVSRNRPKVMIFFSDVSRHVRSKAHDLLSKISLPAFLKGKRALFTVTALCVFTVILIIGFAIIASVSGNGPALPPQDSLQGTLIHECEAALRDNNRFLARNIVDGLSSIHPLHPLAQVLMARVHIRNGMFEQATSLFLQVESTAGGRQVLKKQVPAILDDISRQCKTGPVSPALFEMVRSVLHAGRHPVVRSWIQSPQYWLRWNAVDMLQMSGVAVDLTPVYILDLSMKERIQPRLLAVRKLGEIGSPRALAALREAASHGTNDPVVAQAAKKVLEEKLH
jgi:serine/threonine protein kinase